MPSISNIENAVSVSLCVLVVAGEKICVAHSLFPLVVMLLWKSIFKMPLTVCRSGEKVRRFSKAANNGALLRVVLDYAQDCPFTCALQLCMEGWR